MDGSICTYNDGKTSKQYEHIINWNYAEHLASGEIGNFKWNPK